MGEEVGAARACSDRLHRRRQLFLQRGQLAVLELRRLVELVSLLRLDDVDLQLVDGLLDLVDALEPALLRPPARVELGLLRLRIVV